MSREIIQWKQQTPTSPLFSVFEYALLKKTPSLAGKEADELRLALDDVCPVNEYRDWAGKARHGA